MAKLELWRKGQHVKFFRLHDKQTPLTGTIVGYNDTGAEGEDTPDHQVLVVIQTDETDANVARLEEASPADITVLEQPKPKEPETPPAPPANLTPVPTPAPVPTALPAAEPSAPPAASAPPAEQK